MGRLDNRCERPRAPFICLVTQAPTQKGLTHERRRGGEIRQQM